MVNALWKYKRIIVSDWFEMKPEGASLAKHRIFGFCTKTSLKSYNNVVLSLVLI